jgi:hypothetical protein
MTKKTKTKPIRAGVRSVTRRDSPTAATVKPETLRCWGTQRGKGTIPCLWWNRQDAISQRDPDERVVRVEVTILREVRPL